MIAIITNQRGLLSKMEQMECLQAILYDDENMESGQTASIARQMIELNNEYLRENEVDDDVVEITTEIDFLDTNNE